MDQLRIRYEYKYEYQQQYEYDTTRSRGIYSVCGCVTTVLELISDGNKRRQGQQKTSTWDVKTAVEIIEGGSDSPESALQRSGYALWCIPPQHPVL